MSSVFLSRSQGDSPGFGVVLYQHKLGCDVGGWLHSERSAVTRRNAFGFSSFAGYFLKVKKFTQHNLFKQVARLIITGTVFIILFGNGIHIHSIFDHFFDHGDIHVILHTHPSDDHDTESGLANLDTEDHHQHPIASIDVNGTLIQNTNKKVITESNVLTLAVLKQVNSVLNNSPPAQLAQPPPDLKLIQYLSFLFSLRAPPVA